MKVYAAITLALHEYQGYTMHVPEKRYPDFGEMQILSGTPNFVRNASCLSTNFKANNSK